VFTFESENRVTRHIQGTGGNNVARFGTNIPGTNIPQRYLMTWHTHPEKCYRLSGACVGLPSGSDIVTYLRKYLDGRDKTGLNLIFAKEGLYIIRVKSAFMTAVENQRRSGGVVIPNMTDLRYRIDVLQQPQFLPTTARPTENFKKSIIAEYKKQLELITPQGGVPIFEMALVPYPTTGGISFTSTIHSDTVYRVKRNSVRV
jgi:hypothetical protein